MVEALLPQHWYGLSDPGLEEALGDRPSFRSFVGLKFCRGPRPAPRFRAVLPPASIYERPVAEHRIAGDERAVCGDRADERTRPPATAQGPQPAPQP